jgi:hypothetical protein
LPPNLIDTISNKLIDLSQQLDILIAVQYEIDDGNQPVKCSDGAQRIDVAQQRSSKDLSP